MTEMPLSFEHLSKKEGDIYVNVEGFIDNRSASCLECSMHSVSVKMLPDIIMPDSYSCSALPEQRNLAY